MNFDYSYRAFLITCLLFGILFLAFKSINLSKYVIVEEESFDVEYDSEGLIPELEDLASSPRTTFKVETNRAYNEAEKFISEIEKENAESQENSNAAQESDQVSGSSNLDDSKINNSKKPSNEEEWQPSNSESNKIDPKKNSSKKNSTVSYSLVNRSALYLPNPVYTCDTPGKVVINIVVSETGKILKANYNKSSSTTSNECLVDTALDYAKRADFTTFAGKTKQLGSITYNFPGQQ
jgi:hypothetical protein